ncbi:hypothetical protein chiPu_0016359 [Chiloscyllium punctatum]|uniref:Uncharacterized protein n=1 Tax=Chiloscyllium punctatum TaxID=137246 RepID=A0A401T5B4_CHIPU|nr:hypothetical protein [Chiloscyllium punctatum]
MCNQKSNNTPAFKEGQGENTAEHVNPIEPNDRSQSELTLNTIFFLQPTLPPKSYLDRRLSSDKPEVNIACSFLTDTGRNPSCSFQRLPAHINQLLSESIQRERSRCSVSDLPEHGVGAGGELAPNLEVCSCVSECSDSRLPSAPRTAPTAGADHVQRDVLLPLKVTRSIADST